MTFRITRENKNQSESQGRVNASILQSDYEVHGWTKSMELDHLRGWILAVLNFCLGCVEIFRDHVAMTHLPTSSLLEAYQRPNSAAKEPNQSSRFDRHCLQRGLRWQRLRILMVYHSSNKKGCCRLDQRKNVLRLHARSKSQQSHRNTVYLHKPNPCQ